MGLIVKETGSALPPVPEGVHPGVCYAVYDLGTHFNEKFAKRTRNILIGWELPEERLEIEKDGQTLNLPRVVSKKYTMSLHEKAILRQHLQAWRGRAFTADEKEGFDITKLLGVNCMIQIIHNTSDGKTYANVSNVLPLYKGLSKREPENTSRFFSLQEYMDIPADTPDWIQDIIKDSEEWQTMRGQQPDPEPVSPNTGDVPF